MAKPYHQIIHGDCRDVMAAMVPGSVHCVITSPPYWGLRDYGLGPDQIGLEKVPDCLGWATQTPCSECFVCHIVEVFRGVWRVLRDNGTAWLVLGDSYAGSWGNYHPNSPPGKHGQRLKETARWNRPAYSSQEFLPPTAKTGIRPKSLIGIPHRVALALQADGWIWRKTIIWAKKAPMPESATDRPTSSHEYVFLLAKQPRYFYDGVAIQEPILSGANGSRFDVGKTAIAHPGMSIKERVDPDGRNKRDVWLLGPSGYHGQHYATFPRALVEPCLLAGTPAHGVCGACGAAYERVLEKHMECLRRHRDIGDSIHNAHGPDGRAGDRKVNHIETLGWQPTCSCNAPRKPAVVLDPFGGSGTVLAVAKQHDRSCISIDLDPACMAQQQARLRAEPSHQFQLFT